MRVDESWEDYAASGVQYLRVAGQWVGFDLVPRADGNDYALVGQQRAIFYRTDIAECSPSAWRAATQGEHLGCAGDEYGGGQDPDIMQESHRA